MVARNKLAHARNFFPCILLIRWTRVSFFLKFSFLFCIISLLLWRLRVPLSSLSSLCRCSLPSSLSSSSLPSTLVAVAIVIALRSVFSYICNELNSSFEHQSDRRKKKTTNKQHTHRFCNRYYSPFEIRKSAKSDWKNKLSQIRCAQSVLRLCILFLFVIFFVSICISSSLW